jgi:GT2 family glycosyltransferase
MRVAAAVLHYRSWPEVRVTLDALFSQTRRAETVVVVDNGSGDGSVRNLKDAYPELDLVEVKENCGPIGGTNIALQAALDRNPDAILLLTDDCKLAPDALEILAKRLEEDQTVGAAGPLLASLRNPEKVNSAGGMIDRRNWDTQSFDQPSAVDDWTGRSPFTVDWHNSSALLLRADAARAAGFYHEEFRYYFDEPDYLLRFPPLGWRVECVPAAVAWHEVGEPSPDAYVRTRLKFVARTAPRRLLLREIIRVPYLIFRDLVRPRYRGARSDVWPRFKGYLAFFAKR